MAIDRRGFLRTLSTVTLSAALPIGVSRAQAQASGPVSFPQGVASADPSPDGVILWTRAHADTDADIELTLQVSSNSSFDELVLQQSVNALAHEDHTVRVRLQDLQPGTQYFFRFLAAAGGVSRVGRTRTAPDSASAEPLRVAFVSCQNYEQGFYGAWARMLHEDSQRPPDQQIQLVLHLGDFIYERYVNRAGHGQRFVRRLPDLPDGASDGDRIWADSLADYRHLYRVHLEDPWLQAARARWPFVCTWDDHEFSNDSFQHFSFYDDEPLAEGGRQRRAHRAWFEYIPARVEGATPAAGEPGSGLSIHRHLQWGQLAEFWITDLRSYRSRHPLPHGLSEALQLPADPIELVDIFDGGSAYNGGNPPARLPFGDGQAENTARDRAPGTMLGDDQKTWFKEGLSQSAATWKVWGNSLPILPMRLDLASIPFAGMHDSVIGTDAWNGYPGEYRELMTWIEAQGIDGVVSLSGDHHMQGAATLVTDPDIDGTAAVAVDFNVTGISSTPHFDNVLHAADPDSGFMQLVAKPAESGFNETWNMTLQQGVLASLAYDKTGMGSLAEWLGPNPRNPGLAYIDTNSNGYGIATFLHDRCEVELVTTAPPLTDSGPEGDPILRRAQFSVARWEAGEGPELQGPSFTGEPPFPWSLA